MEEFVTLAQIDQAVEAIRARTERKPRVGMILGSGLGDLANLVENPDIIPYKIFQTGRFPLWKDM